MAEKLPGIYVDKKVTQGDWYAVTVDTQGLAYLMAGLTALQTYESDMMRMPERNVLQTMIDAMREQLSKKEA